MSNVVELKPRQSFLICECGSHWWRATVAIENGKVTGYQLPVQCHDCGKDARPKYGTDLP